MRWTLKCQSTTHGSVSTTLGDTPVCTPLLHGILHLGDSVERVAVPENPAGDGKRRGSSAGAAAAATAAAAAGGRRQSGSMGLTLQVGVSERTHHPAGSSTATPTTGSHSHPMSPASRRAPDSAMVGRTTPGGGHSVTPVSDSGAPRRRSGAGSTRKVAADGTPPATPQHVIRLPSYPPVELAGYVSAGRGGARGAGGS